MLILSSGCTARRDEKLRRLNPNWLCPPRCLTVENSCQNSHRGVEPGETEDEGVTEARQMMIPPFDCNATGKRSESTLKPALKDKIHRAPGWAPRIRDQ